MQSKKATRPIFITFWGSKNQANDWVEKPSFNERSLLKIYSVYQKTASMPLILVAHYSGSVDHHRAILQLSENRANEEAFSS